MFARLSFGAVATLGWTGGSDTLDAMDPSPAPPFPKLVSIPAPPEIDVEGLIDQSLPTPRAPLSLYAAMGFGAALIGGAAFQWHTDAGPLAGIAWSLALVGLLVTLSVLASRGARAQRREIEQTETADELVEMHRFGEATAMIIALLQRPVRLSPVRTRALVTLSRLLGRYGRYEQSMHVQDHLLSDATLDHSLSWTLRLSRTMSMLRLDRLYDADRAINDLRRMVVRAEDTSRDDEHAPIRLGQREHTSAALALVELYRDVKTGHFADALESFDRRTPIFRAQLGHRFADALAMAACAADALGQDDRARSLFRDATTLQPVLEITRRLPEALKVLEKYSPAPAPAEAL